MAWSDPSVKERLDKLNAAIAKMPEIMDRGPIFARNCEEHFGEFRLRVVHLRREREALDAAEPKEVAWKFICRFHKTCPFQHKRCEEVLQLLMLSDAWMKCFVDGAEDVNFDDLPDAIKEEFKKRHQEAVQGSEDAGKQSADADKRKSDDKGRASQSSTDGPDAALPFQRPSKVSFMVQRCASAKVADDLGASAHNHENSIGPGLAVAVSFLKDADDATVKWLVSFLLTNTHLAADEEGSGSPASASADSVLNLCAKGKPQSILVYPQVGLSAHAADDGKLDYLSSGDQSQVKNLYKDLEQQLKQKVDETAKKDAVVAPDPGVRGGLVGKFQNLVGTTSYKPKIIVRDQGTRFVEVVSLRTWFFQF
mmetsp:Transcript_39161/g.92149  ORF Transcript_39161/g.92149 Transcript_39161/m.92149 type:complete len:366 (-) Transcript_39161:107-1204(-)